MDFIEGTEGKMLSMTREKFSGDTKAAVEKPASGKPFSVV